MKVIQASQSVQGRTYLTKKGYPARVVMKARADKKIVVDVKYPDVGPRQILIPPDYPLRKVSEKEVKEMASNKKAKAKKAPVRAAKTARTAPNNPLIRAWEKAILAKLTADANSNGRVTIDPKNFSVTTARGVTVRGKNLERSLQKCADAGAFDIVEQTADKVTVKLPKAETQG